MPRSRPLWQLHLVDGSTSRSTSSGSEPIRAPPKRRNSLPPAPRNKPKRRIAQVSALLQSLALVSGAKADDIIVDRAHRRVIVNANPIPGASLDTYRTLEKRVAADYPDWQLSMRPPALPLPDVAFKEDVPDAAAIALIAWAGPRIGAPVELTGEAERTALVREALLAQGCRDIVMTRGRGATVTTRWAAPDRVSTE